MVEQSAGLQLAIYVGHPGKESCTIPGWRDELQSRCQCWEQVQQTGWFSNYKSRWYVSRPSENPRHSHPSLQPSIPLTSPERSIPSAPIAQLRPVSTMV